jgi:hypothetical protein
MLYEIDPFIVTSLGAVLILAYLSMIFWKENVFSRWAEYSVVGIGIAYALVTTTWQGLTWIVEPLQAGEWSVIIPIILGLLAYAQFTRKWRWLMRWPLALMGGIGITVVLVGLPDASFIGQFRGLAMPLTTGSAVDAINGVIALIGVVTTLSYFTFTKEHTGVIGVSSKIGRYFIMAAMGAGFGMAFISQGTFLLNSLIFLLRDWLGLIVI